MNLNLDNTTLRAFIPNIIREVAGETPLYDRILPWLESAQTWLEQNILGQFQPEGQLCRLAVKITVCKAFADAVPSLDVTLSPAGFAVINTDGRAPASKERIERLVASLGTFVEANLAVLLTELHSQPGWVDSTIGHFYRATFIPDFADVHRFRRTLDILTAYRSMRDSAMRFELLLAESYLGHTLLGELRAAYPSGGHEGHREIHARVRAAELRLGQVLVSQVEVPAVFREA